MTIYEIIAIITPVIVLIVGYIIKKNINDVVKDNNYHLQLAIKQRDIIENLCITYRQAEMSLKSFVDQNDFTIPLTNDESKNNYIEKKNIAAEDYKKFISMYTLFELYFKDSDLMKLVEDGSNNLSKNFSISKRIRIYCNRTHIPEKLHEYIVSLENLIYISLPEKIEESHNKIFKSAQTIIYDSDTNIYKKG